MAAASLPDEVRAQMSVRPRDEPVRDEISGLTARDDPTGRPRSRPILRST